MDRRRGFECLEDRSLLTVTLNSSYTGLDINAAASGGFIFTPPDTGGAAGPTSYVETANQAVRIYTPKETGASSITRSMEDFLFTQGGLARANAGSKLSDVTVIFDDLSQRFIVGDQDVNSNNHVSTFDIAVSKSASPATLTTADWNFYRINTTETNHDADYPGNMGFNHDAFVVTLTQFATKPTATTHVQVTSIAMSDLVAGNPITPFQNDINSKTLRPTVMHNSVAGDPMWLIAEGGGNSINVVKMTSVLSNAATFTTTNLAVNAYSGVVAPRQPDGSTITTNIDSRIIKAAEVNNTIVAAQAIGASSTEDDARWYTIDVSGATPAISGQGNVSAGNNNYIVYPSVDINSSGDIGMTYLQSGTAAGKYMSMYITGRRASDPAGTMETPVLVKAGVANEVGGREGDLSGINVDSDGSFWAANEWAATTASTSTFANWSTAIAHFTVGTIISTPPTVTPPADQVAVEGASKGFDLGSFSDPDGGPWSVTVAWGDGLPNTTFSIAVAGSLGTQLHTYTEEGLFTVTVTVQDSTGLSDTKTFKVNASDPAVVATGGFSFSAVEGTLSSSQTVATFTDPGGAEVLADYGASINWG
ncbi:MAG: PKD domain-containing protein, partial [Planctomycetia bacterium]|nr:PKD domain-containing protein [Planctomycetia bacterium]